MQMSMKAILAGLLRISSLDRRRGTMERLDPVAAETQLLVAWSYDAVNRNCHSQKTGHASGGVTFARRVKSIGMAETEAAES